MVGLVMWLGHVAHTESRLCTSQGTFKESVYYLTLYSLIAFVLESLLARARQLLHWAGKEVVSITGYSDCLRSLCAAYLGNYQVDHCSEVYTVSVSDRGIVTVLGKYRENRQLLDQLVTT